jgi:hypothetical protein
MREEHPSKKLDFRVGHIRAVAQTAVDIAESIEMDKQNQLLAYQIGYMHDLFQVRQIAQQPEQDTHLHHSSPEAVDYILELLRDNQIKLSSEQEQIMRLAIFWHAKASINDEAKQDMTPLQLTHCELIRDADKATILDQATLYDILEVDHNFSEDEVKNSDISPDVISTFMSDFTIPNQLCYDNNIPANWLVSVIGYTGDINFPYTKRIASQAVKKLVTDMPFKPEINSQIEKCAEKAIGYLRHDSNPVTSFL